MAQFFWVVLQIRNGLLPSFSKVATESENTHNQISPFCFLLWQCWQLKQGASAIRLDILKEDIKKKLLCLPGPFCSAKCVYNSFSSSLRPSPQVTEQCFQELATESLGSFKKVQKSTFFYKALPLTLANSKHHLGALNLSLEKYKTNVLKKDDILPSSQRDKMLENHPQEDEWRAYLHQEGTPILDEWFL